ncbi:DUF6347 domain-containing protein [Pantoea sp. FN0305]|uniref:DUF6347 domain-containing protein n=1 Tax=Pantoea sp. FN0305 TaxID=3418559 RepID=UPI003CE6A0BC
MDFISTRKSAFGAVGINIALRSAIDTIIIGGLFFYVNPNRENATLILFFILFPLAAIISTSGEVIYDRLKLDIAENRPCIHRDNAFSLRFGERIWLRLAVLALFSMLIAGPLLYIFFLVFISAQKAGTISILTGVWLVIMLATYFTVSRVGNQISDWYRLRITQPQQETAKNNSDRFMVFNYFLPWAGITMAIAGLLSWAYFSPQRTDIDVETVAFSCGGTAYIIALWVAHVTQKQAKIDIKASLLRFEDDEVLDEGTMYFLIHAWSGCVIVAIFIISRFFSWASFTPLQVTLIDALVAGLSAIAGALSGLLRARTHQRKQEEK